MARAESEYESARVPVIRDHMLSGMQWLEPMDEAYLAASAQRKAVNRSIASNS